MISNVTALISAVNATKESISPPISNAKGSDLPGGFVHKNLSFGRGKNTMAKRSRRNFFPLFAIKGSSNLCFLG